MDPATTVRMILDAVNSGDVESARESCADLRGWLRSGGFPPNGWSPEQARTFLVTVGAALNRLYRVGGAK